MDDDRWVRVEWARRLGDAALLRNALESADIEARLRGEHLPSIAGELPLPEAQIEIWVREADAQRARQVLEALRAEDADGPPRVCPKCGEENPSNFDLCWSCNWPLTA